MLTVEQIRATKPTDHTIELYDSKGLRLRVLPSGKRTWSCTYRDHGRWRRKTLGHWPAMGLKEARAMRDAARGEAVGAGALTLRAFARQYVDTYARPRKKSWELDQRILERNILPELGDRPLVQISRREVAELTDEYLQRGARNMAARVHAVLRRVLEYAVERGLREYNPALRMKLTQGPSRDRVLTSEELATWWPLFVDRVPATTRIAIELVIVTCQRLGEVLSMEPHEVDRIDAIWTIPASKAKNGITHVVPLTDRALALIAEARERNPYAKRVIPLAADTVREWMRDTITAAGLERATPHDCRRTGATWLGLLGFDRNIQSRILNHKDNSIAGIYDRYEYMPEKRAALEAWNRRFADIVCVDQCETNDADETQDESGTQNEPVVSSDEHDNRGREGNDGNR